MFFANKMKIAKLKLFKTDEENQNMSEGRSTFEAKANNGASTSKIKDTSLNDICYEQIIFITVNLENSGL